MKAIEAQTCVEAWLRACDYLLSRDQEDWRALAVATGDPRACKLLHCSSFGKGTE